MPDHADTVRSFDFWPGPVRAPRLDLVPATLAVLRADLADPAAFAGLLKAAIPPTWPPELLDRETRAEFVRMATEGTDPRFGIWYWVWTGEGHSENARVLVGSGGVCTDPEDPGAVAIGYSVLPDFWNRGFATEAVRALVPEIYRGAGVNRITASTDPDYGASIRVLEKCGFVPCGTRHGGEGIAEGSLRFCHRKETVRPVEPR